MSENFNLGDFTFLAKKLLDKCENGEEFLLGDVYSQVRQAYDKFPEDAVIRQMSAVFEKMAEKNSPMTFVSQKKISSIYNDLIRLDGNSKFRTVLGHLLVPVQETKKATATHMRGDDRVIEEKDLIDPEVKRVLASTFDNDLMEKAINKELANKGINLVRAELKSIGFSSVVKIAGGDSKNVVYSATMDTVRGPVSVFVPAVVEGGKFVMPNSFIDDQGEKPLHREVLATSLERRGGRAEAMPGIKLAEIAPAELSVPTVEMPKELAHLTRDFESKVVEASSSFGPAAVETGKKVIATELRAAGFKNAQVRYGSDSNDTVIYFAGINTPAGKVEIEVPLEMKATLDDRFVPMMPTCFAYNEALHDFNSSNLQKFALSAVSNTTTGNPLYSFMTLSELKEEMIKAASVNDYTACEEIIGQVGKTFDDETHKNIIADFHYILTVKAKATETQTKHAEYAKQTGAIIPAGKGSLYARRANGTPIKDLVKDENGHFVSANEIIKEKLNPIDESGACIQTSTILFS